MPLTVVFQNQLLLCDNKCNIFSDTQVIYLFIVWKFKIHVFKKLRLMICKICKNESLSFSKGKIMGKYIIEYYHCDTCDFVQTEEAYWLEEAYSRPINLSDTGYMSRNLLYSKQLTILLYLLHNKNGKYMDYAGGYGIFVRLMRDIGFDFYWDDKYTQNLFASGFEWDGNEDFDAVTLFEVFEHFNEPIPELESLFKISRTIIFSTELHPTPMPKPNEWWYYGLEHGQHIALYSEKTFKFIADKFKANYYRSGSLHILTYHTIPEWKIKAMKLAKLGLHNIVARKLKSKTWDDHMKHLIINK